MINRIISEHIKNHKRIVVPGFGAFIRKDTGEVVLVEFLKKDDGVLTSLIVAREGIGEQEALEAIAQYIAKVKRNVAQTGDYYIEGLGRIYVTSNGLYELEYLGNTADSDTGVPTAAIETPPQPISAPPVATPVSPGTEKGNPTEEAKPINTATTPPANRSAMPAYHDNAAARPSGDKVQTPYPTMQQVKTTAPITPAVKQQAQQRPAYRPAYVQPKQKKRTDLVMIIAISAAIIALAAMAFKLIDSGPVDSILPVGQPTEQVSNGNI